MSRLLVIDERPKRDPERLRRAHIRAHQARMERQYGINYRHGRKVVKYRKDDYKLFDAVLTAGGVALVVLLLGVLN